jgi:hypothetical protein
MVLVFGSLAVIATPPKAMLYLLITTFFYLIASLDLYKYLLGGIRAILPFLAAYSIFAAIVGIDIGTMLLMIFRLCMLMILLSYFTSSLNLHRFMEDMQSYKEKGIFSIILFFTLATLLYLKQLKLYYKRITNGANPEEKKLNPISGILNAIQQNWMNKDKIQAETDSILSLDYPHRPLLTAANVWGCIYITSLILILSI